MATALTTIFGNEIRVGFQPRIMHRQYAGFPGANGLTGIALGSRGYPITVTGTLAETGTDYQDARTNLVVTIEAIEAYLDLAAASYSHMGEVYDNVVFERFQLIPDAAGKFFHWTSEGYVTCRFVCLLRSLI